MKSLTRLFLAGALLALLVLSCKGKKYSDEGEPSLRTGDLVFVAIPASFGETMADAIASSAGGEDSLRIIHVAIAEIDEGGHPWIIDATIAHGVDRHPLDTLFADFALPEGRAKYIVKRLEGDYPIGRFVEKAKTLCGQPYDVHFHPDNDSLYCSELVRESYRLEDGEYLFDNAPMNFKDPDGEFPAYWLWLFNDYLGEPIPQGLPGTNPAAMLEHPLLSSTTVEL